MKYQPPTSGTRAEWQEWHDKYGARKEHLEKSLRGMEGIQRRFDRTGENGLPEAYLLGFDPEGTRDGRVIVANGNPDTADHTAVYVPGTTTTLETIGGEDPDNPKQGDLGRGDELWRDSNRLSPNKNVSTITWFDYNAPDTAKPVVEGDLIPEASDPSYSQEAAPVLNDFMRGVETSQGEGGSHTTVIGHSYGSTVVGEAAKQAGSGAPIADDIVTAGSPGMQVSRANELGVEADRVWAMAAPFSRDQVPEAGKLVGLGDDRIVPTDPEFGGNIMSTDSPDHGGYWNEDSTSLRNQAGVITGNYDEVDLDR